MSGVKYRSTRGAVQGASFENVVLAGLAPDRGLYVPESIPKFTPAEINKMKDYKFEDLAYEIMSKYIPTDEIPRKVLRDLINKSYKSFTDADRVPTIKTGDFYTMELFHGPTFAFKDVALQFLGNLFEYFIGKKSGDEQRLTIMGATSGDTGGAAIYGLRGKKHVDCYILYPKGRVSKIQERQMTTVEDGNIHCLRIEGTFDDCQDIVKGAFMDTAFKEKVKLGAVNSINWARVLAQMTYYFFSYYQVAKARSGWNNQFNGTINFSVPTGNFGDILAGYYAKKMGLPVGKLIVGTNENDILARFFDGGEYEKLKIAQSISPSMDICVSSNFERYLFHLFGDDPSVLKALMEAFEGKTGAVSLGVGSGKAGKLTVNQEVLKAAQSDFLAGRANTKEVLECIKEYQANHNYLFCPHSACGVVAAKDLNLLNEDTVVLATAHIGKFYEGAVTTYLGADSLPPLPDALEATKTMKMRTTDLPMSLPACQTVVLERGGFPEEDVLEYKRRRPASKGSGGRGFMAVIFAFLLIALLMDYLEIGNVPGMELAAPYLPWKN